MLVRYLPFASTLVVFVFAYLVLRRFAEKGGRHLLLWGIGLIMYGLGTLAEALLAFTYSSFLIHMWYLFGAILTPAWLGQGTIYLLIRRARVANIALIILTLVTLFTAIHVYGLVTHDELYTVGIPVSAQYKTVLDRAPITGALLGIFAGYGTLALVGGALYSAYIFWRKRIMPQRVIGNVLIAVGGLSPALGGVLVTRGLGDYLFVSELVGAIIMFIGFRLATTQQPVEAPLTQSVAT
jgi:hypothetical protein